MSCYGQIKGKLNTSISSSSVFSSSSSNVYSNNDQSNALTLRAIWEFFPFVFRINDDSAGQTTLTILEKVCKERGWKEFGEEDTRIAGGNVLGWNLWWRSVVMMNTQTRSLYSWQYTNHIPKAINFCNKEYLASFIRIMEDRFGDIYNFCPATFTLPRETEELEIEHNRLSEMDLFEEIRCTAQNIIPCSALRIHNVPMESGDHHDKMIVKYEEAKDKENDDDQNAHPYKKKKKTFKPIWICKPVGKSQGKGICLISDLTNLPEHPVTIVQEYISKPLLISNYKFDLRLYVSIVSISPLTIYAYKEGLTRFATETFDLESLEKSCSHLTNASLNKLSPGYETDKHVVGTGCKWTLTKLRSYLKENGYSDWYMWQRIMSIIVLTILGEVGQQAGIPSTRNNFDFLGYDILIDSNLRPWLLETNLSPFLGGDCEVDEVVKKPMLHEFFTLIGLPDQRPYVQVVPASSISKNNNNNNNNSILDIDIESNTALQLTSEADMLNEQKGHESNSTNQISSHSSSQELDTITKPSSPPPPPSAEKSFEQTVAKLVTREKEKDHLKMGTNNGKSKKNSLTKDLLSPKLRKRLLDATAIYSQSLSIPLTKSFKNNAKRNSSSRPSASSTSTSSFSEIHSEAEAARLNFLATTDWIGSMKQSGRAPSTLPHRPGLGLQRRSWYDAPDKHGDWIRIFPFDFLSFQMTRGHLITDIRAMVQNLEEYLNFAENLSRKNPGKSDEYYNAKVREHLNWNKNLWMPPVVKKS